MPHLYSGLTSLIKSARRDKRACSATFEIFTKRQTILEKII